ncbi:MAG TPA: SpoIIE family protein phosphatase [Clostridia bacterium]|jgi:hypothetical protein|nr:SpoIIE family protein phosphatase [Clostridia bacterium]
MSKKMRFYEDKISQKIKTGEIVCGDHTKCHRSVNGTVFALCDGIGSGIYANISAISCSDRIVELFKLGVSLRSTVETVAASMQRARTEDHPFSAFSAVAILPDGQFSIYTYEAPQAIIIKNGTSSVLKPEFFTTGYEVVGETVGVLDIGDSLVLCSDGVTQAGLGHGYGFGIGIENISDYINKLLQSGTDIHDLPEKITDMCARLMNGRYEDDTTLAVLHCQEANELTVMTGPPSKVSMDKEYVERFISMPGKKAICGSTTADIVARETGRKVETLKMGTAFGIPPEYAIEGIDFTGEGAIILNQVYNILDEPVENFTANSAAERLCMMMLEADVIHMMIGNAMNDAHEVLLFKQVGVRVRRTAIKLIAEKLREKGKLVIETYY